MFEWTRSRSKIMIIRTNGRICGVRYTDVRNVLCSEQWPPPSKILRSLWDAAGVLWCTKETPFCSGLAVAGCVPAHHVFNTRYSTTAFRIAEEIQLGIICIAVMQESTCFNYMADVCSVDEKEERAKDRAPRNTVFDMTGTSGLACELNGLSSACKVRLKQKQWSLLDTEGCS